MVKGKGGDVLSRSELTRYYRQLLIPELGEERQKRLKGSHAIITGVGGLGCASASKDTYFEKILFFLITK